MIFLEYVIIPGLLIKSIHELHKKSRLLTRGAETVLAMLKGGGGTQSFGVVFKR